MIPTQGSEQRTVRVWDPPVRLFHWGLVVAFAAAWATGDEWDRAHEIIGYGVFGLVVFRVVWGFVGTRRARFADFVHRPSTVTAYLKDVAAFKAPRYLGHNPAGGAMVIAMLAMLTLICGTGFMLTTDTFWEVKWVDELHEGAVNVMLALVAVHVLGVLVASREHGENLVKAMFTGRKRV